MKCLPSYLAFLVLDLLCVPHQVQAFIDPVPTTYISFVDNDTLDLFAWEGENLALLTKSDTLDPLIMDEIVSILDSAYRFYEHATGRKPSLLVNYNGKLSMAQVPGTCGAGCGLVGGTGIEILDSFFDLFYDRVKQDNQYDQVPFYELGRNFWFFGNKLASGSSLFGRAASTGYAVFMRYESMAATGVAPAPFRNLPFSELVEDNTNMIDQYLADPGLTFENTLALDLGGVTTPKLGLNGGASLFASFLIRLKREYGEDQFVNNIWKELLNRPNATTDQQGIDNFILASSIAAGENLTSLFQEWRWPVSEDAIEEANSIFACIENPITEVIFETFPSVSDLESGAIEIKEVIGGTPPYEYSLSGGEFQASPFFTNLSATIGYQITVRDAKGCVFDRAGAFLSVGCIERTNLVNFGEAGFPRTFTEVGSTLYFIVNGTDLWRSDGTTDGTSLVKEFIATQFISGPDQLMSYHNTLFFVADDGINGRELWQSDGTSSGTKMVLDLKPGPEGSNPFGLIVYGDTLFFIADDGISNFELWKTDGSADGTKLVKDINEGNNPGISGSGDIIILRDTLFFGADDGVNGIELWKSDGTENGTQLVKDINDTGSSFPQKFTVVDDRLFFTAEDGNNGRELWMSDGTSTGTKLIKDINQGGSSHISSLVEFEGKAYFSADDGINGEELWQSDGTESGTVLLKDINSSGSSEIDSIFRLPNKMVLIANDGITGRELWSSDGTETGTFLLIDITKPDDFNTIGNSFFSGLDVVDGFLYFTQSQNEGGGESWRTDGTLSGTKVLFRGLIFDIASVDDILFLSTASRFGFASQFLSVITNSSFTSSTICSLDNWGDVSDNPLNHAIYLYNSPVDPNLEKGNDTEFQRFKWVSQGTKTIIQDTVMLITGLVQSTVDPDAQFDVFIELTNPLTWHEWLNSGGTFNIPPNADQAKVVNEQFDSWTYWALGENSRLEGRGTLEGTLLLTQAPNPQTTPDGEKKRVQVGKGANDKDDDDGISGWFFYEGTITYKGLQIDLRSQGDVNVDVRDCREICGEPELNPFVTGFEAVTSAEGDVYLTWGTIVQGNAGQLTLERSIDGQFFESISSMDGKDMNISPEIHQFIDKPGNPGVPIHYRLKIVDHKKNVTYSALKSINFKEEWDVRAIVYPNPADNEFSIQLIPYTNDVYAMKLWDVMGRIILSRKVKLEGGKSSVDISKLPRGNYFIQIIDGKGSNLTKMISVE